jgi:hypothetical protein
MKKALISIMMAAAAALLFCSCEPMEKTGDPTGTVVGSWRLETCLVEIRTTVGGNTNTTSNTTDYSKDYVYLFLGEKFLATGYYNLEIEAAKYEYDAEKGTIRFSDGISVSDNGKAMVLVGTYKVEVTGNKMILKQAFGIEAANEQTTYTFHREERVE